MLSIEKYYELRETADNNNLIGVIKSIDNVFDYVMIRKAINAHLDEEVEVLNVHVPNYEKITVEVRREYGDIDFMEGEIISLFF